MIRVIIPSGAWFFYQHGETGNWLNCMKTKRILEEGQKCDNHWRKRQLMRKLNWWQSKWKRWAERRVSLPSSTSLIPIPTFPHPHSYIPHPHPYYPSLPIPTSFPSSPLLLPLTPPYHSLPGFSLSKGKHTIQQCLYHLTALTYNRAKHTTYVPQRAPCSVPGVVQNQFNYMYFNNWIAS